MVAVQIAELKERADEIVRRVRDTGEPVEIVHDGQTVAKLVPPEDEPPTQEELDAFWEEWDQLSKDIGELWPEGVSAVDAVRADRREL